MTIRVYVIGGDGQVARALREAASTDPEIIFGHGARPDVDLLKPDTIDQAIGDFRPDIIINPAAYTAVDKAEAESDLAYALNRDGARAVSAAAAMLDVPIVHFSTDYVFDGQKTGAYVESDPVAPQGVYGRSKLAGEQAVAEANPKHIVLRTAWVYSPFGANFVKTMLRLATERDRLRVVDDQAGCPTYAPDIADAVLAIAHHVKKSGWQPHFAGITHLAGPDALSWYAFAQQIVALGADRGGRKVPVDPITTADYPTPAARPANSQLATDRLQSVFGVKLPPLARSLANCLDRLFE